MIAVSVLFRYSDFVITYLKGSAFQLGLIVGVGMVGALGMRIFQGRGIDRYGPRVIWLGSLVLFIVAMLSHLLVDSAHGPGIFLARILLMVSLAGAFGASLAYISLRVPEGRIAEIVGTLGTSGFVGLAAGPVLGDMIFEGEAVTRDVVNRMFLTAAAMGALSLISVAIATRKDVRRRPHRQSPPLPWLIKRYHPGPLLLVAAAMGLSVTLPHTFLRAYTARLDIGEIGNFFLVYSGTAFVVRVATRRLTERWGFPWVILIGLVSASLGTLLYLTVTDAWTLGIPAIFLGVSHALLFPAVVAAGSISFPSRYRGVATTLTLAMFDLGTMVGQPAVGALLVWSESVGLPPFATMFCVVSPIMALAGVTYFVRRRGQTTGRSVRRVSTRRVESTPAELPTLGEGALGEGALSEGALGEGEAARGMPAGERSVVVR